MEAVFQVGDRVICTGDFGCCIGEIGTIVRINGYASIAVHFDNDVNGHTCGGLCPDGHGWNVPPEYLEHEYDQVNDNVRLGSFTDMF